MRDAAAADALVERIVAAARIPSRAARDDLRRELRAHFDDAAESPGDMDEAVRRFGAEAIVADSLRRVYRRDYVFAYLAKTAASIAASLAAAVLIQAFVNLRMPDGDAWHLAPQFSRTAGLSMAIALAVITAWEILRAPFNAARAAVAIAAYLAVWAVAQRLVPDSGSAFGTAALLVAVACACSALEVRPAKLLVALAAFAAAEYAVHAAISVFLGPARALLAGAIQLPVWASTLVILARIDRAFMHNFETVAR